MDPLRLIETRNVVDILPFPTEASAVPSTLDQQYVGTAGRKGAMGDNISAGILSRDLGGGKYYTAVECFCAYSAFGITTKEVICTYKLY